MGDLEEYKKKYEALKSDEERKSYLRGIISRYKTKADVPGEHWAITRRRGISREAWNFVINQYDKLVNNSSGKSISLDNRLMISLSTFLLGLVVLMNSNFNSKISLSPENGVGWQVYLGFALILIGAIVILYSLTKKKRKN